MSGNGNKRKHSDVNNLMNQSSSSSSSTMAAAVVTTERQSTSNQNIATKRRKIGGMTGPKPSSSRVDFDDSDNEAEGENEGGNNVAMIRDEELVEDDIEDERSDDSDFRPGDMAEKLKVVKNEVINRSQLTLPNQLQRSIPPASFPHHENRNARVKWSIEEDEAFFYCFEKYGPGRWVDYKADADCGDVLRDRNNVQIKDRYRNLMRQGRIA